jgi:hypothetical protein
LKHDAKKRMAACLTAAAEIYGRQVSEAVAQLWCRALSRFDSDTVESAFARHLQDADRGRFMPTPADIIRAIDGTPNEASLRAWTAVETAIRFCDWRGSVAFDDPLIHQVVADMSGFSALGRRQECGDWPFVAKDFRERYVWYRARGQIGAFPPVLHFYNYDKSAATVFIGDSAKARAVAIGDISGFALEVKPLGVTDSMGERNVAALPGVSRPRYLEL